MGPINYADDADGNLLPLVLCKEQYRKSSVEPFDKTYDIDSEVETGRERPLSTPLVLTDGRLSACINAATRMTARAVRTVENSVAELQAVIVLFYASVAVCLTFDPKMVEHWKAHNASFFDLDFSR